MIMNTLKTVLLIWGLISIIPFLGILAVCLAAKKTMPRFEDDIEANTHESTFNEEQAEQICPNWAKSPKSNKRIRQPVRPPIIGFARKANSSPIA